MSRKTELPADALREIFRFMSREQLDTLVTVSGEFNRLIVTSHKPIRWYTLNVGASTQPAGGLIVGVHDVENRRGAFFRTDRCLTQLLPLLSRKWTRFKELSVTLGPKGENDEWLEVLASHAHCVRGVETLEIRLLPQYCSIAYARILNELVPKAKLVRVTIQDGHLPTLNNDPFAFTALKNAQFVVLQSAEWYETDLRISDEHIVNWLFNHTPHEPGRGLMVNIDNERTDRLVALIEERFLRETRPSAFFCELEEPLIYADQLAQMPEVRIVNEFTGEELHIRLMEGFKSTLLMHTSLTDG